MQILIFIGELFESFLTTSLSLLRQFIIAPSLGYMRLLLAFIWVPEIIDIAIYREIVFKHKRVILATITLSLSA